MTIISISLGNQPLNVYVSYELGFLTQTATFSALMYHSKRNAYAYCTYFTLTIKVEGRWLNLCNFTIIKNTQFTSKNVEKLGSRSGRKQLIIIYDLWCCPPLVTGPRNICNEIHCVRTSSTHFYRVKKTYNIYKQIKLLKY